MVLTLTYWNISNALFDFVEKQSLIFRVNKMDTENLKSLYPACYEISYNKLTTFSAIILTKIRVFNRLQAYKMPLSHHPRGGVCHNILFFQIVSKNPTILRGHISINYWDRPQNEHRSTGFNSRICAAASGSAKKNNTENLGKTKNGYNTGKCKSGDSCYRSDRKFGIAEHQTLEHADIYQKFTYKS